MRRPSARAYGPRLNEDLVRHHSSRDNERMRYVVVVLLLAATIVDAKESARKEPLVDRVQKSIAGGVRYLRARQRPNGGWEVADTNVGYDGGTTALAVIALLNSG